MEEIKGKEKQANPFIFRFEESNIIDFDLKIRNFKNMKEIELNGYLCD